MQPARPPIRVLIVEDHQVVAEALAALLGSYPDLEVVGWVNTVAGATEAVDQHHPDVVLVDFRLPDGTGADVAARIGQRHLAIAIVFLSADDSDDALIAAVEAGAAGYFVKSAPSEEIAAAIERAARGEVLLSARRLGEVVARRASDAGRRANEARIVESLTPREREVLGLLAQGLSNQAIAERLHVEHSTVRSHVHRVLEKLGVRSRLEAVVKAGELGIGTT